jgi:hypothetical protein
MEKKEREALEAESPDTAENREPKAMVTLGGTARTASGKLTKSGYLRFLGHDLDQYEDIELSPEQARSIHNHLEKLATGTTAMVPLYCAGARCPFAARCPLQQMSKAPLGRQCLIETQLLKAYVLQYFEEFDIDPANWTEVAYVNELAEIDIYLLRLNMLLARPENAELVTDQTVGISHEGEPILQKQISPYMEQKDKLYNRRSKVIKLMVGDRQEKYKKEAALKMRLDKDASSAMAETRAKLESLQRSIKNLSLDPLSPQKTIPTISPEDIIDGEVVEIDGSKPKK